MELISPEIMVLLATAASIAFIHTLMGPDHSLGETTPIAQDAEGGGIRLVLPRGTDDQGRVYFQMMPPMRPGAELPDSGMVARWDRA